MRILIVTMELPFPPIGGGRLRTHHFLEALSSVHDVTVAGFTFDGDPPKSSLPIEIIGVTWDWPKLYQELQSTDADISLNAFNRLSQIDEPWAVSYYQSSAMANALKRVTERQFDLILFKDSIVAQYLPVLPADVPKILDFQDVLTRMAQREAAATNGDRKAGAIKEAERMLRFERWATSQCVLSMACSSVEAAAAKELLQVKRVEVVPNEVDTTFFAPSENETISGYLLYTGTMSYAPNVEAVIYFTSRVLPRILREVPNAKLHIVGKNPPDEVIRLASDRVTVHGEVSDMRPYYRDAEIVVVPLLQGGGTRRKILEAAASGKAVVTTSLGVEGLEFYGGRDLLIADSEADFADAVITLHRDGSQRRALGAKASGVASQYDAKRIGAKLCSIIDQLCVTSL
jgi:glycosyltransferase involved in cell wall biosynthesis